MRAKPTWKSKPKLLKGGHVPEKVIQKQILTWLETTGLLMWRQHAGSINHIRVGPDGISDIVVIIPPNGRFLALEVKSARGLLRPTQRDFRAQLEASGGIYRVVRSLAEAQNVIAEVVGGESWKLKHQLSTAAGTQGRAFSALS